MKRIVILGFLVGIALAVIGAEPVKVIKATTEDGRHVMLMPDGKWQFEEASTPSEPEAAKIDKASAASASKSADTQKPDKTPKTQNWKYSEYADKMGRGNVKSASTSSVNTVSFKFPYAGVQHAIFTIRSSFTNRYDIMLSIRKGQFLASNGVDIRFDDGELQHFSAETPSDHSSELIFISVPLRFVTNLRRANKMLIQATFFQEGTQVFKFNIEGFQWEVYKFEKDASSGND